MSDPIPSLNCGDCNGMLGPRVQVGAREMEESESQHARPTLVPPRFQVRHVHVHALGESHLQARVGALSVVRPRRLAQSLLSKSVCSYFISLRQGLEAVTLPSTLTDTHWASVMNSSTTSYDLLSSLLPSHTYTLVYALPLFFVSFILTFAGSFLTLDRTRSFAPSTTAPPQSTQKPSRICARLSSIKWSTVLEGGIGGLASGYVFGGILPTHRPMYNIFIRLSLSSACLYVLSIAYPQYDLLRTCQL